MAEQNTTEGVAEKSGEGERVDGEMIYIEEEDDETVDSGMTSSEMGCTHDETLRDEHLGPGAPPLTQPSQTNDSNTSLNHT